MPIQSRMLMAPEDSVPTDLLEPIIERIAEAVVAKLRRAEQPRLLTMREAAQYLTRSERWLRQQVAEQKIPCVRNGNSRPRFDREELDRWIAREV